MTQGTPTSSANPTTIKPNQKPEIAENFGTWMLVKKPQRKKNTKQSSSIAVTRNEAGFNPTRKSNGTRSQTEARPEKGSTRNHGTSLLHITKPTGSRFEILRNDMIEDLTRIGSGSQEGLEKEREDSHNMESEIPLTDSTVMKENIPEFTGMETQNQEQQVFAFVGGKSVSDSTQGKSQRTPLAPRNKNIGPRGPPTKPAPYRGPVQFGPKPLQKARNPEFLRSPNRNITKPILDANLACHTPSANVPPLCMDDLHGREKSFNPHSILNTHSPVHSNDPPCIAQSLLGFESDYGAKPSDPPELGDQITHSNLDSTEAYNTEEQRGSSRSASPSPSRGHPQPEA